MEEVFRNASTDISGDMPQGTHACLFYHTKEDLTEIIVPYLKAGLEKREFCIWILPEDISLKEAKQNLKKSIPDLKTYLKKSQLEILSREALSTGNKNSKLHEPLNFWLEKLNKAFNKGYSGLKLVQDLFWLKENEESSFFLDYEKEMNKVINSSPMTALCTYPLEKFGSDEVFEVIGSHEFSLVKKEGDWKQLGSFKNQKITSNGKLEKAEEAWFNSCKGFDDCIRERTADLMYSNIQLESEIEGRKCVEEALRESKERQAFLLKLSDAIRSLSDAVEIQATATRTAMDYFGADRCYYCEIEGDSSIIRRDASRDDLPSVVGVYSLSSMPIFKAVIDTGCPLIVCDSNTTELMDENLRQLCVGMKVISYIDVPVIKDGKPVGILCITQSTPRNWTDFEVELAVEIAERTWEAVERARTEQLLQKSEEKYRKIVETAQEGVWIINEKDQTVYVNQKLPEMLGYSTEEIIGQSPRKYMSPEFEAEAESRLQEQMQGISHVIDYRLLRKDGSDLWCILSSSPIFDERGKYEGSTAMITDITGRKQAEEELKNSREQYRILFNSINEGFGYYKAIYDKEGKICDLLVLEINPAGAKISGIEREVQLGKTWREIWSEIEDYWLDPYRNVDRTGESVNYENFSNITGRWYSIHIDKVRKGQFVVTFRDITEQKQEEHRINRYNTVLEGISRIFANAVQAGTERELGDACLYIALDITESQKGFIGIVGSDGLLHDIAISNMGGDQCLIYDKAGRSRLPGNFDLEGLYGTVINSGKSFFTNNPSSYPDSIGLPEGHPKLNSFLGVPFILNGKVRGILAVANREGGYNREQKEDLETLAPAIIQAIERKKIEQEREQAREELSKAYQELEEKVKIRTSELETAYNSLKENERRLSEAQKMAHIGYWDWDILNNKLHWSEELFRIFKLHPQKFGGTYEAFLSIIHPEDRAYVENAVKKALSGAPYSIDFRAVLEEGEERIVHVQGKVLFNNKNIPVLMRGTAQDITEKKRAEQAFLISVAARKKEIHHRIKNNLQVISSLLDLQAEKFGNKEYLENSEIVEAFKESQDRVVSMALIHEELHEGGGNDWLNFSQYLEKLIEHLFMTYTLKNVEISLDMDLQEDIFFDMDTAVPLGIIVNELVSNSLKYAFSGREEGEIRIRLYREENQEFDEEAAESPDKEPANSCEKRYTLIVSDDGIGIPETISLEDADTLGIQLVTILVDQLDGKLELNRNAGTEFIIKIPVTEEI